MITNLSIIRRPSVHMDMLKLRLPFPPATGQTWTDKHVIQFLATHVEEISIAFILGYVCYIIHIGKARDGFEGFHRCDVRELVEVTAGNDACILILLEDLCNEGL